MKKFKEYMKRLVLLFAILIGSLVSAQETSAIQGQILDAELFNEPLLMATVTIKNTSISTHTNFRGNFEFDNLTPGSYQLLVQFLGYEPIELPVTVASGETKNIQASLKAKTMSMAGLSAQKTSSR
ncbi:carboxypeptidase-like regulatory domain-containing protein [Maribacter confluentis]|uniref:Carboxypeptidase-like regulatory domain-containing protein n=2 Tax=Maribacter confluentis TaxID=1656093 RepID=A0ABT8RQF3_9FLAO|nr:carboxypeptidase-like regulatory domain-containing protein [Maribacter confluentis]MDO1513114.1 carboxypeptidase-like regulatory domain-containing protein [Maribacter confluentis]